MIHTVEMLFPINYQDVQSLFSRYKVNVAKYKHFSGAVKRLKESIIKEFPAYSLTWLSCEGKGEWNLHMKIDLPKMLNRGEITEVDYKLVEADIRIFLMKLLGSPSYFSQHRLTRIDYRLDIVVPQKSHRDLIFFLYEKYTKKYGFKKKVKWGRNEQWEPMKYETSQYHMSKSVVFIIYSKEDECNAKIKKGEKTVIEPYEKDVVRFELRLMNNHLNSMKSIDKGKSRPKKLEKYFNDALYKEYMQNHIFPIIRKGDYYKITKAEKVIENSHFTRRKKEKLRSFLVTISEKGIDAPKQSISLPTYRQYLKDLETIGINAVLIPKNRTDFPNYFKNPFII